MVETFEEQQERLRFLEQRRLLFSKRKKESARTDRKIKFLETTGRIQPSTNSRVIDGLRRGLSVEQSIEQRFIRQRGGLQRSRFEGRRRKIFTQVPRHKFSPLVESEILDPVRIAQQFLSSGSVESEDVRSTIEAGLLGRFGIGEKHFDEIFVPRCGILDL